MNGLPQHLRRAWLLTSFLSTAPFITAVPVLAGQAAAQPADRRIDIIVLDQQGLPIADALIEITEQGVLRRAALGSTDRSSIGGLAPGIYQVRIASPGFEEQTVTIDLRTDPIATVEIRLEPGRITEQLVVTPTRTEQRLGDVAASVSIVRAEVIQRSPALVADDVLRQVPTFSLFRRTSSLAAHPTAQGVSLRGIGPSGVSRTLVLLDNVPFNDPFGGWVYWTRVPLMAVQRIEMVDGATSSVYGNFAMGGVVNIVTNEAERRTLILKPQYGTRSTPKLELFASDVWGRLGASIEASALSTDGYKIVAPAERGQVDIEANVRYENVSGRLDYAPSDRATLFFRGGIFDEERSNGKILENNDTNWKFASGGLRLRTPDGSDIQARLFFDSQNFRSTFLAVPPATPPRSVGRLTLLQHVPTKSVGGMSQWSRTIGGSHFVTAGADFRWIDGDSRETALDAVTGTVATLNRISGGTQRSIGAFVSDLFSVTPELQVTLGLRVDHWRNYDAKNLETTIATGLPTPNSRLLPNRDDTVGSPRIAGRYHLSDRATVWGALSWGFRAPTLNELYRQFRVGTVLTLANDQLGPERLTGGEVGLTLAPTGNLTVRTTWFDNRVEDPVSNVTQSIAGAQITRRRQNLGRTRVWGIQSDVEYRVASYWRFSAGYLFDRANVRAFPADPTLVGRVLPQVPKHRGSLQVTYSNPRHADLSLQMQFVGAQFDDDLNRLSLPGYGVVDVTAARLIGRNVELFLGMQNLFDTVYQVGKNPTTIGTPRMVNGGVRVRLVGR